MMRRGLAALAIAFSAPGACSTLAGNITLHPGVTLVTGDTWIDGSNRYRLYGVQSCLRGTYFTNASGQRLDCGDTSMALLAAFVKDTRPVCTPVAKTPAISYVVCLATIGDQQVDLGTAIISRGYGFASLEQSGLPSNPAYAVAEQQARATKSGLWQFPDVQHPSIALGRAAAEGTGR